MKLNNAIVAARRWLSGWVLLPAVCGVSFVTHASPTTNSWILGEGGYWNVPENWEPAGPPNAPEAMAILTNSMAAKIITNDVSVTLGTLWIGDTGGANNFTITNDPGFTWTFDNNGAGASLRQLGTGSGTDRISTPIELADNLTISGETATKTVNLSGAISELGGARSITKLGQSYLTLGTANAFSGGVLVKAGRLNAAAAGRAGTGLITLGDTSGSEGADLIGSGTYTNSIVVAAGSSGKKVLRNSGASGAVNFNGPITLEGNVELQAVSSTRSNTVNGKISGDGAVTTVSVNSSAVAHYITNFVSLKAANEFTGGVTLQTGTLKVGNHAALGAGTLTINGGTIFCSDNNSNRQITNDVVVNGDFRLGLLPPYGAGTIVFWKTFDLGPATRMITHGSSVGHGIRGPIIGEGGLVLQDINARGLTLYGTNTFAGGLTVLNGIVNFYGDSAFGTGRLTLGDSTTTTNVQVTGNGIVPNDILVVPGISGTRTLGCTNNATAVYSGNITLDADLIVGVASAIYPRSIIVSGPISGSGSLLINGDAPNEVTLAGDNTYLGNTTVAGGTLIVSNATGSATGSGAVTVQANAMITGTGAIDGAVTIQDGATLIPGLKEPGVLTIRNTLTLSANSTNVVRLDKSAGTNDVVMANSVSYGGTLVVTNLAGTLTSGDAFNLFHATGYSGDFNEVRLLDDTLTATFDPATGTLTILGGTVVTPTNITFTVSGDTLALNWPESHLGWVVQSNAVSVADPGAWHDVAGSQIATNLNITVNPDLPQVYYRLRKP